MSGLNVKHANVKQPHAVLPKKKRDATRKLNGWLAKTPRAGPKPSGSRAKRQREKPPRKKAGSRLPRRPSVSVSNVQSARAGKPGMKRGAKRKPNALPVRRVSAKKPRAAQLRKKHAARPKQTALHATSANGRNVSSWRAIRLSAAPPRKVRIAIPKQRNAPPSRLSNSTRLIKRRPSTLQR